MVAVDNRAQPRGGAGWRQREQQQAKERSALERSFVQKYALSYLYSTVKTHRNPFGWRFISGGKEVSLSSICTWVHKALFSLLPDIHSMHKASVTGVWADDPMPCWQSFVLSGAEDVVERIRDLERGIRASNDSQGKRSIERSKVMFSVMDFTTLYPSLPHDLIKEAIEAVIDGIFSMHSGKLLSVYKTGATGWSEPKPGSRMGLDMVGLKYFSAAQLKRDIFFIIDNVYMTAGPLL